MQATYAIDKAENLAERPERLGAEQAEQMAKAIQRFFLATYVTVLILRSKRFCTWLRTIAG
jgi:hypothetical protein